MYLRWRFSTALAFYMKRCNGDNNSQDSIGENEDLARVVLRRPFGEQIRTDTTSRRPNSACSAATGLHVCIFAKGGEKEKLLKQLVSLNNKTIVKRNPRSAREYFQLTCSLLQYLSRPHAPIILPNPEASPKMSTI